MTEDDKKKRNACIRSSMEEMYVPHAKKRTEEKENSVRLTVLMRMD